MGEGRHICVHCGGGGFWRRFTDGFRGLFGFRRKHDRLMYIKIARIIDNPFQPREYVLEEPHDNLKKSIEQFGMIVPIIVNRMGSQYQLVAGQRRLKAAKELGFQNVPAIVRSLTVNQMMEVSTLENLHRESLSSIDVVEMFDRIIRKHPGIDEEDVAEAMGLKVDDLKHARSLLTLPIPALEALRAGMISENHAHLVSKIEDTDAQLEVIELIYNEKINVDETNELVNRITGGEPGFVTADQAAHFHSPCCPFALLIPEDRKQKYYSKKEVSRKGKVPCMQCL